MTEAIKTPAAPITEGSTIEIKQPAIAQHIKVADLTYLRKMSVLRPWLTMAGSIATGVLLGGLGVAVANKTRTGSLLPGRQSNDTTM